MGAAITCTELHLIHRLDGAHLQVAAAVEQEGVNKKGHHSLPTLFELSQLRSGACATTDPVGCCMKAHMACYQTASRVHLVHHANERCRQCILRVGAGSQLRVGVINLLLQYVGRAEASTCGGTGNERTGGCLP